VQYQNICSAPSRFVTIHACDRRTDRITTPKTALAYARVVKNSVLFSARCPRRTNRRPIAMMFVRLSVRLFTVG